MRSFRWWPLAGLWLMLSVVPALAHLPDEPPAPVPSPDPLTLAQRAWLSAHPVLRLAPDPDFAPIEFFEHEVGYVGLAADYAHLLEQKIGCRFSVVRCADWSEVLARAQRREVDVLNATVPTPEREQYLRFVPAYLHMPMVIITRQSGAAPRDPQELSGMRVALVKGYGHAELIVNENPAIIPVPAENTAAGLRLVAFGQVDAFYHDLATASYAIEREGIANLRVSGRGTTDNNSGFAVRSDWPELVGIIASGLALITPEERRALEARWLHMPIPEQGSWRQHLPAIATAALVVAALLLLAVLVNVMLKREVQRRTQALAEREQLLRTAVRIGHMGYGTVSATGDIFWTPEVHRLHGIEPGSMALTQENIHALIHPDDHEKLLQTSKVVRSGSYAPGIEYRVLLPNGRVRWLFSEWQAMHDARGNYTGLIGINQDITAQKENESELRRERDFSERILNAQRDTVAVLEMATGRLVRWNDCLCEISGYNDEEIAGTSADQFHPPDQQHLVRAALAELLAGKQTITELDLLTRDGRRIPYEFSVSPLPDAAGKPQFCCSVGRDISERAAAAAALRRERDFSERILNAQRDTVTIVDVATGRMVRWNQRALEVSGYNAEEMPGLTLAQMHPADHHAQAFTAMAELQRDGRVLVELDMLTRDGRRIPYEYNANVLTDADGNPQYYCVVGRDISERTAAAAVLRASEEKYRLLAENTADIIWSSDGAGQLTFVSPSAENMLGYSPEEAISLGPAGMLTPESHRLASAILREELACETAQPGSGGGRTLEADYRHRDGHIVHTEVSFAFQRDSAGRCIGVSGITRDITERLHTMRALDRARALLQAAIDQSPMGIMVADAPGGMLRLVNAAARDILGLQPDESALGIAFGDYAASWRALRLDGAPCAPAEFPLARAIAGETVAGGEMLIVRHDGSRRWILANAGPVRNAQGELAAGIIVFADHTLQHLAQRSLEESEARLRTVLESIPFDIWMMDETGHYVEQNEASRALWGDIRGKTPDQVAHNDGNQASYWQEQNRRVLAGERLTGEVSYRVNDAERHFLYLLNRIGAGDRVMGIVGINIDITDRKLADMALRESEQKYRTLFSSMSEGVCVQVLVRDAAGTPCNYRLVDVNRSFETILGLKRGEVIGKLGSEVYNTPGPPYFAEFSRVALTGEPCAFETYFPPLDRHFSVSAYCPERDHFVAVFRDITARKKAEESCHASERRYRTIFEHSGTALMFIAEDTTILLCNREAERLSGFTRAELENKRSWTEFVAEPADLARMQEYNRRRRTARSAETPETYEFTMLDKHGRRREIAVSVVLMPETRQSLCALLDITERKRAEERMRRMNAELARANEELRSLDDLKSNLLSNVSHELRTPLVAVRGYAELMREGISGSINETQRNQFGIMLRNIDRLLELIGNLLDFSRHEGSGSQLVTSEFAVADLEEEVIGLLLPKARERNISLLASAVKHPLRLVADRRQLQQVLINIMDNALKFTPAGGSVTLGASEEGETVLLTVTDTGIGIPAAECQRIFERFYQIDSSSTRVYGGVGIGLAISLDIVERHGGKISVASTVGQGTTFTISLPRTGPDITV